MRKFLLTLFSVLLFVCLGVAVACTGNQDDTATYYTLVFRQTNGVRYECDVPSGWEVKEGTTVNFKVVTNSEADGNPIVYANNVELQADNGNSYSVVMDQNIVIRVDGLMAQGDEYNKIVFESAPGVTYNGMEKELEDGTKVKLESGMMVKMHEVVSFTVIKNPKYEGTARVYANSTELTADAQGVYSLDMIAPTKIRVEGLVKYVSLTYESRDTRVKYYTGDENNRVDFDTDTKITKVDGDEIAFKVQISVYHQQDKFKVLANKIILRPDYDGYYRLTLTDDTVIQVSGLEEDISFIDRRNGGSGTMYDPFRIVKPIDLYQMAMQINSGWFETGTYYAGYYSLEADIDMKGEQLYIIGDGSTGISVFSGTFYGNGHTISNYFMNDLWTDQENFNSVYITNVGLFGYIVPTNISTPAIYDLHIDNFRIVADASKYPESQTEDYTLSVGGFAGVAYGVDLESCSATNGTITVTSGNYGTYVGGFFGQQVSAYSSTTDIAAYTRVAYSYADVDISVSDGGQYAFAYAVGGITGSLVVGEEHLSASILNSYSNSNIAGGLNVGGIAGYASAGTSIINCYSTGDLEAYSHFRYQSTWDEEENAHFQEFYYANAGGIVGRLGFNSVIYNCFTMSELIEARISVTGADANKYRSTSATAAYIESGSELQDAHSFSGSVYGCPDKSITKVTDDFIRNTMHWDAEDWLIENGMPVINYAESDKTFKVSFVPVGEGNFGNIDDFEITNQYMTMSMWNSVENGIPEYMESSGNNNLRSYAYFFDAELKNRVFYSFIPTGNVTLYVGFADYGEVVGTYYLGESADVGASLEIEPDGTFVYRNSALVHASTYTWDGENLVLLYAFLADLAELPANVRDFYLSSQYVFGATLEGGKLTITGGYVREVEYRKEVVGSYDDFTPIEDWVLSYTGNSFYLFTEENPLVAVRAIDGFVYGNYYNGGDIYTFNGNGTGLRNASGRKTAFTYTVSDRQLTVIYSGQTPVTGTIDVDGYVTTIGDVTVNPYDGFSGTWESAFAINESYWFNGKASNGNTGEWTFNGGNTTSNGTYTISGNVLTMSNGLTAKINEDGFLEIAEDSISYIYYMGGSFMGEWSLGHRLGGTNNTTVSVSIELDGISNDGYGTAYAKYNTGEKYNLTYHTVLKNDTYTIYMYQNGYMFASMNYDAENAIFSGSFGGMEGCRMSAYDAFRGVWVSDDEYLRTVQFDGNGFTDLASVTDSNGAGPVAIRSSVFVNGANAGKYSIDRNTMVGTYSYKGITYTLTYNAELDAIEASTSSGSNFKLIHRDIWYGRALEDENGVVYTFEDGRGNLENGGKLTVSNGNSYTYFLNDNGSIRLESQGSYAGGTISIQNYNGNEVFMFVPTTGASIALTRHTAFTGKWAIGGESGTLNIGKIYANDKASGSYHFVGEDEVEVEFNYNFAGNYLTFDYEGTTFYVNAFTSGKNKELSIGPENNVSSVKNSMCIDYNKVDDYFRKSYNIYNPIKGEDSGSTLVFDGLGTSVFGNGTAVEYNREGEIVGAYSYSIRDGVLYFIDNYWEYYMVEQMIKPARGLTQYELLCIREGDTYFMLVRYDSYKNNIIADETEADVTYHFDGLGTVTRRAADGTETKFAYFTVLTDNVKYKHILQFTDAEGKVYSVTFDKSNKESSSKWTIKMSEADEYFGLIGKDANSTEAYFLFDGAGRVIRISYVDSVVNYTYKVVSKDGNVTTFIFTDESGDTYTATFDMTAFGEYDGTVTLK